MQKGVQRELDEKPYCDQVPQQTREQHHGNEHELHDVVKLELWGGLNASWSCTNHPNNSANLTPELSSIFNSCPFTTKIIFLQQRVIPSMNCEVLDEGVNRAETLG